MEFSVWSSEFGLPSFDVECLQFMVASKLCAAQINFTSSSKPWGSPTGDFPYALDDQGQCLTKFEPFVEYLRNNRQDVVLDYELIPAQFCEFDAYNYLLKQKLRPAMLQMMWLDKDNFNTVTYCLFTSRLFFPYNFYYIDKKKKFATRLIESTRKNTKQLYSDAILVINLLSSKLGDNKYFSGDKPCSLDALIFGYLAPLLRFPFPNDRIQLHLISTPNLVRFVESILSIYLPPTESQLQEQSQRKNFWSKRKAEAQSKIREIRMRKEQNESQKSSADSSSNYGIGYFGFFFAAAVTVSVMFAVHFGLIPVEAYPPKRKPRVI